MQIISASDDRTIKLWTKPLNQLAESKRKDTVYFSVLPDKRWRASFKDSEYSGFGKLKLPHNGKEIAIAGWTNFPLNWHFSVLHSLGKAEHIASRYKTLHKLFFAADGRYIVLVYTYTLPLMDIKGCYFPYPVPEEACIYDTSKATLVALLPNYKGDCIFSYDGTHIKFQSLNGDFKLLDLVTGKDSAAPEDQNQAIDNALTKIKKIVKTRKRRWLHDDYVYSPDSSMIASISQDSTVRLWNAKTGHQVIQFTDQARSRPGCKFSPDGSHIAAALVDNTVRIWNTENGKELINLQGHSAPVNSLTFSPDGIRIVTASKDNSLKLWSAYDGTELITLKHDSDALFCKFSPDGSRILSLSQSSTLTIWDISTATKLATFSHDSMVFCNYEFLPDGSGIITTLRDKNSSESGAIVVLHPLENIKPVSWLVFREYFDFSLLHRLIALQSTDLNLQLFKLEGQFNSPLVTAVRLWLFGRDGKLGRPDDKLTVQCIWCGKRFEVKESMLGKEVSCSHCGKPLKLNPLKAEPPPL